MKSLQDYLNEALNLDLAKEWVNIKRLKGAEQYMMAFWEELKKYCLEHGGSESRNKYRLYIPYTGPAPEVTADDTETAGSKSDGMINRDMIKNLVAQNLDARDQWIDKWDYIAGTCDVAMKDQQGNVKIRAGQKIGKLMGNSDKDLLTFFANDPIRLGKNILSAINSNNLSLVISNHAYDIAGMSTNRDWTSCMNIINGDNKVYVKHDIQYGTLVAYIIDKKDTNIEHPYGRILIKPYKLQRQGYHGFDPAPVVYSPEVTVYSPYLGLKPIREWLKDICEEIQDGDGIIRSLKTLYNDTYHDIADKEFHGKKNQRSFASFK
jgi:hypothetical protein